MTRGALMILPLALGAGAYGFAFGLVASSLGFPAWGIGLMGVGVFAGSSQIVAVDQFAGGGGGWSAVGGALIAGTAMNLRYLGILASLSDVLRGLSWPLRLLAIHLTSDENWALTLSERAKDPAIDASFLIGGGFVLVVLWAGSTALGAWAGAALPDVASWGVGFAFTAAFIAMARGLWRGRRDALPYATAFAATVAAIHLGAAGFAAILIGAACGTMAAGIAR